jgi:hypothetical protein
MLSPCLGAWTTIGTPANCALVQNDWAYLNANTIRLGVAQGNTASVGWQLPMTYSSGNPVFFHRWTWNITNQIHPDSNVGVMDMSSSIFCKLEYLGLGDYIKIVYTWTGNSAIPPYFREQVAVYYKDHAGSETLITTQISSISYNAAKGIWVPYYKIGCEMIHNCDNNKVYCDVRVYRTTDGTSFGIVYNSATNFKLATIPMNTNVVCKTIVAWALGTGSIPTWFREVDYHQEFILGDFNGDRSVDVLDAIDFSNHYGQSTTNTIGTDTWFNWSAHCYDLACIEGSLGTVDMTDALIFNSHHNAILT